MKLGMAMIFVKDLSRMTEFYREALGFDPLPDESSDGWVVLEAGGVRREAHGVRLALHAIPPAIAQTIEITRPPRARSETPIKLIFETEDLAGDCARLEEHGATLLPPRSQISRDFIDPEGNVLQVRGTAP